MDTNIDFEWFVYLDHKLNYSVKNLKINNCKKLKGLGKRQKDAFEKFLNVKLYYKRRLYY